MRIIAVIPARYASSRLPGKPLLDICGKPMIERVYERAKASSVLDDVIVATDDERIRACVEGFGGKARITREECASGTDRLLEVASYEPADVYINIQGDEPLLKPAALDILAASMRKGAQVATLAFAFTETDRARDPNLVKVVLDSENNALYFSRAPIPYPRDAQSPCTYLGHIGVYAYTKEALERFGSLPPSPLEAIEKLEQLRYLQAGIPIHVDRTEAFGPGVDTADDLALVRALLSGRPQPTRDAQLRAIRLVITDVDGVLTDGSLIYGQEGEILKCFNAKDGLGLMLARERGIQVAVLSGRDSSALRRRLADLGISAFCLGRNDKGDVLGQLLAQCNATKDEAVFLGDDVADIPGFKGCALGVAVADAHPLAREAADIVLKTKGGKGALRELLDMLPGN
ncbi:MAG: 3-deoxy-manno-octulosonate cytidylyltransferase [Desulfovibrionaceae bacterium]|nr:3-deoxy-manno-octulosonate cytidylyltransferase [Desulfovibrionaceae bacterium]